MKKLTLILIFLILITIGEVVYYFILQENSAKENNSQTSASPSEDPTQVINNSILRSLKSFRKGIVTSSVLVSEYRGEISELDKKSGTFSQENYEYEIKFKILGEGNNYNTIFLSKKDLDITQIVRKIDDKESPITINDLNNGDKIILEQTMDLLKEPKFSVIKYKIIKI